MRRLGQWFGERIPRVTSRGAVLALVLVLGVILGSGLAIVSLLGKVDSTATTAKQLGDDSKAKTKQIQALVLQLHDVVERNHNQRLSDQAETDRELRDIICTFISIDKRARVKLLPLLPIRYVRSQCKPQAAPTSPRPQGSESPAPPGVTPSVRSGSPGRPVTRTRTVVAPRPTPSPTPTRPGRGHPSPPILDTPVLLCHLETMLGLRCTP